jgi:radical SAM superfamily enzyme YgiQ (UPF0313 family)
VKVALLTAKNNEDEKWNGHRFAVDEKRPPHGIGFLYSILKRAGADIEIFDRYCGNYNWPVDNFKSFDFVGIYCASVCRNDFLSVIDKVDNESIAVGGPHASLFEEDFSDKVKYIVKGEAEKIILDLVCGNLKEKVIKTDRLENEELDKLPRFPFDIFIERKDLYVWDFPFDKLISPVFTLNTSRSCPFDCSFCSTRKIWGRKYTYMSPERVYEDILYCISLGAKGIYFREDNFTVVNKRVESLCNMLLENNISIKWACETRVDTIDERLVKLMAESGCIGLYIGVEHLSQRMLDIFNKRVTVEQIIKCFEWAHKYKISTAASLIRNHPEETIVDRELLADRLSIIRPTMYWANEFRYE